MSAADIEGLTDQIVEYTPGERGLAERIARGIWPLVVEAQARVLVEAADEWFAQSKEAGWRFRTRMWFMDRADALSGAGNDGAAGRRDQATDAGEGPLRAAERASSTGPLIHDAELGTREAIVPLPPKNWPGRTTRGDGDGTSEGDQG